MLDLLIHLALGPASRAARTYHDHQEALRGHSLLARVFFPDVKEPAPVPPPDDTFLISGYGVTA